MPYDRGVLFRIVTRTGRMPCACKSAPNTLCASKLFSGVIESCSVPASGRLAVYASRCWTMRYVIGKLFTKWWGRSAAPISDGTCTALRASMVALASVHVIVTTPSVAPSFVAEMTPGWPGLASV